MKNNFLDLKSSNTCTIDDRILSNNDFLELVVTNKLEEDLKEVFNRAFLDNGYDECEYHDDEDDEDEDDCFGMDSESSVWERLQGESEEASLGFLYAGYVDCMDEAIRFLVEEENISPDHPIVKNLKAHLEKSKERILGGLDLMDTFSSCNNLRGGDFPLERLGDCRNSS